MPGHVSNSWEGVASAQVVINYAELDAGEQEKKTLQPKDEVKNITLDHERNRSVACTQAGCNLYHQVCMKKCLTPLVS